MTGIDFREHDQREHGRSSAAVALEYSVDLRVAQGIRESMRAAGLRVPVTDEERFAEAERRLRASGQGGA